MSFLSRMFGGTAPPSQASLVGWADRKMKELERVNAITPETMFVGFMYALVSYAREDGNSRQADSPFRRYKGDAALFELGCYVYFRIDLWLFANHPEDRPRVSGVFVRDFNRLFTETLELPTVRMLFNERTTKYGEFARAHASPQRYYECLAQLIVKTGDNQKPLPVGAGAGLDISSFGDLMFVQMQLASWENHMLPAIICSLDEALSMMK